MKRIHLLLLAALQATLLMGQKNQPTEPPQKLATEVNRPTATSLLDAFQHGQFHGNFRTYFMATDNARTLSDYYALAAGGAFHYSTASWHRFNFGIGGQFGYNLASSDLSAKDPATGAANRYEIGLFDVEDPKNRSNLDRIDDLWLRYQWKKSRITIGQQSLQTPFVNNQDGRMRPNGETGAWVEVNDLKNTKLEGGWLWKISPRGTVKWYGIGESIGVYPKGLNPDGTSSGYYESIESKGMGLVGITRLLGKRTKFQAWDLYAENIFNTAFLQTDYTYPVKNGHKILLGLQLIHQDALANGGNDVADKTYIQKGGQSNVVSTQAGWQHGHWQALADYTCITADGRFLSPREWGREPFYTYMPRERVEGSGNSHSVTGRLNWQTENKKLRIEAAYGQFYLPDVKNPAFNKYAFPSFRQFNFDLRYAFGGVFEGLQAQFLYVRKGRMGNVYNNDKYVINKVDMSLYNLIFNYTY